MKAINRLIRRPRRLHIGAVVRLVVGVIDRDAVIDGAGVDHLHQPPLGVIGLGDGLRRVGGHGAASDRDRRGGIKEFSRHCCCPQSVCDQVIESDISVGVTDGQNR